MQGMGKFMPSCPVVYYVGVRGTERGIVLIECHKLEISVECYVSTGIVSLQGEWVNPTEHLLDCIFALPTNGTVTSVQITLESRPGVVITSSVVSNEEANRICDASKKAAVQKGVEQADVGEEFDSYIPDLFRLPFSGVAPGDRVTVVCQYMQDLQFTNSGYRLKLPLTLSRYCMPQGAQWAQICSVHCKVNALDKHTAWKCRSHVVSEEKSKTRAVILLRTQEIKPYKESDEQYKQIHDGDETEAAADEEKKDEEKKETEDAPAAADEKKSDDNDTNKKKKGTDDEKRKEMEEMLEMADFKSESVRERQAAAKRLDRIAKEYPELVYGRDFDLVYSVKAPDIQVHAISKPDPDNPEFSEMAVFVTPMQKPTGTFPRAFFFCLDRSGSMAGEAFSEASRALFRVLDKYVRSQDVFNVTVFDHRSDKFRPNFVKGSKLSIGQCKLWIQARQPDKGGTVMDTVIEDALNDLEASTLLPYLILFTDGSVPNEHDICESVMERFEGKRQITVTNKKNKSVKGMVAPKTIQRKMRSRIFTMGIGNFCNWYYLKMLAQMGRGRAEIVVYREQLYSKIEKMMKSIYTPILTDVSFAVLSKRIEIYPYPIPDLYSGIPLVFSVRYQSTSKSSKPKVIVRGFNPKGDKQDFTGSISMREDLPVEKIFIKQQLDLLSAQSWFKSEDRHLKEKVVELSTLHSLPVFGTTTMLTFEAREDELRDKGIFLEYFHDVMVDAVEEDADGQGSTVDAAGGGGGSDQQGLAAAGAGGGAAAADDQKDEASTDDDHRNKQTGQRTTALESTSKMNNAKTVATVAVAGTALVVATSAATFGDIQSTLDNLPLFSDIIDFGIDTTCLEDLDCDCDCDFDDCECDEICEGITETLECLDCADCFDCTIL